MALERNESPPARSKSTENVRRGENGTRLPPGAVVFEASPSTSALVALDPVEHAVRLSATTQSAMSQIAYKPSSSEGRVTLTALWRFIDEPAG